MHASSVASRRKRQSRGKNPILFASSSVMSIAFKMSAVFMIAIVRIMVLGFIGISPIFVMLIHRPKQHGSFFTIARSNAGENGFECYFSPLLFHLLKNSSYLLQFIIIQNEAHSNFLHPKKKTSWHPSSNDVPLSALPAVV